MEKHILITGMGDGGSNNLVRSLEKSCLDLEKYTWFGSNLAPEIIAQSPLPLGQNFLLPPATDPDYPAALTQLVRDQRIDLVIPNNDREVAAISAIRDVLSCRTFLPDNQTVQACQDKVVFYNKLTAAGIPVAKSYPLERFSDIGRIGKKITTDRIWIRPKSGSGSKGATWVNNAQQAEYWINLWVSLRGYKITDFTMSEFLPGRDYCFQSVWKNGRLLVCGLVERLSYLGGANRLSNMSSSPSFAKTIRDDSALKTIFETVRVLSDRPHGNFSFDLKGRSDGRMCITECNIGRFCMITPIFDLVGRYNMAEMHVRAAFDEEPEHIENPIDIQEGYYLVRTLDNQPKIVSHEDLEAFENQRLAPHCSDALAEALSA